MEQISYILCLLHSYLHLVSELISSCSLTVARLLKVEFVLGGLTLGIIISLSNVAQISDSVLSCSRKCLFKMANLTMNSPLRS
jgi:hypothetical protein